MGLFSEGFTIKGYEERTDTVILESSIYGAPVMPGDGIIKEMRIQFYSNRNSGKKNRCRMTLTPIDSDRIIHTENYHSIFERSSIKKYRKNKREELGLK